MVGKGCDCVKREKHKNIDKNVGGKNDGKTGKVAGGKIIKNKYLQLFVSVFKLSACTFGGGFVIIPLMRKKFVDQLHWIEEQEMLDLTASAQSSPGAIAVNAAILVGYRVGGIGGALLTVIGTILPPLLIISVISMFYRTFRDNAIVNMAMAGMLCGVAAVLLDVVINMTRDVIKQKRILPVVVLVGAFIAVRFFNVSVIIIILICGLIGALDIRIREIRAKGVKRS